MNRSEIPIASPCTADWSAMTLADRGRFCGDCKKVVRELAQMTETEARAMLASPPTEGLCVRYIHDATGEIVFRRDVVPLARLKRAAAVALAAASPPLAMTGCMGAPEPPQVPPTMGAVTMGSPPPPVPSTDPATPLATDGGAAPTPVTPVARDPR